MYFAVICIVVAGLFVGSYFIKYPEVIAGLITITAEAEPSNVKFYRTTKIHYIISQLLTYTEKINILLTNTKNLSYICNVIRHHRFR